jgi:hypothetical protein
MNSCLGKFHFHLFFSKKGVFLFHLKTFRPSLSSIADSTQVSFDVKPFLFHQNKLDRFIIGKYFTYGQPWLSLVDFYHGWLQP